MASAHVKLLKTKDLDVILAIYGAQSYGTYGKRRTSIYITDNKVLVEVRVTVCTLIFVDLLKTKDLVEVCQLSFHRGTGFATYWGVVPSPPGLVQPKARQWLPVT